MNQKTQTQTTINKQPQLPVTVKYPELSDAELEVICGGGNLIGRKR